MTPSWGAAVMSPGHSSLLRVPLLSHYLQCVVRSLCCSLPGALVDFVFWLFSRFPNFAFVQLFLFYKLFHFIFYY